MQSKSMPKSLNALSPGHRLGEYRIERYLGSGGFGTCSANDVKLDHRVAIKEYLFTDIAMRDVSDLVIVTIPASATDHRSTSRGAINEPQKFQAMNCS